MNKIVAVGDIHGQFYKLLDLMGALEEHGYRLGECKFVFLGDLVDGGPETRQVVEWIKTTESQYPEVHVLLGNHEHLMLDALRWGSNIYGNYYLWYMQGGRETFESYIPAHLTPLERGLVGPEDVIPSEHLDWLETLRTEYETNQFIFVHAGLRPTKTVHESSLWDKIWIREDFIDSDYDWGKRVVYGHTYTKAPLIMPNKIGIDTMHHGHGVITSVVLDDENGGILDFITDQDLIRKETRYGLAHKHDGEWTLSLS
jgi:serine/threonine protein phosphatase 1